MTPPTQTPNTRKSHVEYSDTGPIPSAPQAPLTFNDVMSAFAALQHGPEQSVQKVVFPVAIALIIGLLGWVGTTLGSLTNQVTTMQPTLAIIQKSVDNLTASQEHEQEKIADMETKLGQDEVRLDALDNRRIAK